MAQTHNELRRGLLSPALQAALGDTRGGGGIERYGETLTPILNLWGMPEWAALRGEQLCAIRLFQAAVAAEFGAIALMNPAGSNMVVVVEAISFASSAAVQCLLEVVADTVIAATLGTVTQPTASRDRRFKGPSGRSQVTFRQGTDPTNTFGAQLETQFYTGAGALFAPLGVSLPVILAPGDDLMVIIQTVNLTMTVNWAWRERQAFKSELGV